MCKERKEVENELPGYQSDVFIRTTRLLSQQLEQNIKDMDKLLSRIKDSCNTYFFKSDGSIVVGGDIRDSSHDLINSYNQHIVKNNEITSIIHELEVESSELSLKSMEAEVKGSVVLKAQEMERSRIACDLHDSVVQNLTSMVHKVEYCTKTMESDMIGTKLDLQIVMKMLRSSIDDIRSVIYNLRPMALDDLGLEIAVRRYIQKFQQSHRVQIKFTNECEDVCLSNFILSITLFRVIQEACSNAVKHGKASRIDIILGCKNDMISLNILDNGDGFDTSIIGQIQKEDNSGFGLSIMKERIDLLSGKIQIKSSKKEGTSIYIEVPVSLY